MDSDCNWWGPQEALHRCCLPPSCSAPTPPKAASALGVGNTQTQVLWGAQDVASLRVTCFLLLGQSLHLPPDVVQCPQPFLVPAVSSPYSNPEDLGEELLGERPPPARVQAVTSSRGLTTFPVLHKCKHNTLEGTRSG